MSQTKTESMEDLSTPSTSPQPNRSTRGFASMSRERQREIASMGGKAVPDRLRSFSIDRELAKEAGRRGGQAVPDEKRSFSLDPELARRCGRKGGVK